MEQERNLKLTMKEAEFILSNFAVKNGISYPNGLLSLNEYKIEPFVYTNSSKSMEYVVRNILNKEIEYRLGFTGDKISDKYLSVLFRVLPQNNFIDIVYRDSIFTSLSTTLVEGYSNICEYVVDNCFKDGDILVYGYTYKKAREAIIRYLSDLDSFLRRYCNLTYNKIYELEDCIEDTLCSQLDLMFNKDLQVSDSYINDMMLYTRHNNLGEFASVYPYSIIIVDNYFRYYIQSRKFINSKTSNFIEESFREMIIDNIENKLEENKNNSVELGNLLFGNGRLEYSVPREWILYFNRLLRKLGFDGYGFDSDLVDDNGAFENDVFSIRPYYWGDDDDIASLPNFEFKKTGFKLVWYKYPLRDSYMNQYIDSEDMKNIIKECITSLK